MDQLEQITNEPIEMELAGKKYKLRAYSLVEFAVLRRKLQADRIDLIQNRVKNEEHQLKLLSEALKAKITDDEVEHHIVETMEGLSYILQCMLIKDQPEVTTDDCLDIIRQDGHGKIWALMTTINSPKEVKKKKIKKANQ